MSSRDPSASGRMERAPSRIELEAISADQAPVLQNLFELYAYDFSEFVPLEIRPNGRFDVALGDLWWTRDDHFPFFLRHGGKLCGFALVRKGSRINGSREVMDVAEFFVLRGERKQRIGTSAAHALFSGFPGAWEVRVRTSNVSAVKFWSRAVETWVGPPVASVPFFSADGVDWAVFRFESPQR